MTTTEIELALDYADHLVETSNPESLRHAIQELIAILHHLAKSSSSAEDEIEKLKSENEGLKQILREDR